MRRLLLTLVSALVLIGCQAAPSTSPRPLVLHGTVSFETGRHAQATMGEVTQSATVTLIDASTGNTLGSSVTDASGAFTLTFTGFSPSSGASYYLEALKGLSVGGAANRAGASAARLRTLLFWNSGWQSLTNSALNSGIMLGNATTALSTLVSLKQQAGITVTLSTLIGKVNEGADTFDETGTGLSNANDFQKVLPLVGSAIAFNQDPLRDVAYNRVSGTYGLATGLPWVSSIDPAIPTPGGTVTVHGGNFDAMPGRSQFYFGRVPAATWSFAVDRSSVTVSVPATAFSAPFFLLQPGGLVQMLDSFLELRGTVGTYLGTGLGANGDGYRTDATVWGGTGITVDSDGTIYFVGHNGLIRRMDLNGMVTTLAGSGSFGFADGTGTAAQFNDPYGLALGTDGCLYVADYQNNRIRRVTKNGVVTTFAGNGTAATADGTGTGASVYRPVAMATHPNGDLYFIEFASPYNLRKVTPAGVVTTIGPAVAAHDLAFDSAGNAYANDYFNNRLAKITLPAGTVTTLAGSGTAGSADGTGTAASFYNPVGVEVDAADNIYVTDWTSAPRLRKVSPAGVVTSVAGTGVGGFLDGTALSAMFTAPHNIAFDPSRTNLYIMDASNNRIRVYTP